MSIPQCNILEFPETLRQWYKHIRFRLSISGNSCGKLHCGNVVNMPYYQSTKSQRIFQVRRCMNPFLDCKINNQKWSAIFTWILASDNPSLSASFSLQWKANYPSCLSRHLEYTSLPITYLDLQQGPYDRRFRRSVKIWHKCHRELNAWAD